MHSGFNKTATIRVKTAGLCARSRDRRPGREDERAREEREEATVASCTGRENGKAEGNLNEETRDNAWAKHPEQNGTPRGWRGGILGWWLGRRQPFPRGREGGWVKTTAESN